MKTTFVTGCGDACAARSTCSTISPGRRLRSKPAWPVAQNVQAIAQPAWLETQTVARVGYRMRTVSISAPSLAAPEPLHRLLVVPGGHDERIEGERERGREPLAQGAGERCRLLERRPLAVERVVHLVGAVARLAGLGEPGGEVVAGDAVAVAHRGGISASYDRSTRCSVKPSAR